MKHHHTYRWTGRVPCSGVYACVHCGLTKEEIVNKLKQLAELEGVEPEVMLENAVMDSVVPGICMSPECDFIEQVEPDARRSWCPACEKNTVKSCLVIAGVI